MKTINTRLKESWLEVKSIGAHPKNYDSRQPRQLDDVSMIVVHVSQSSMKSMDAYFNTPRPANPTSAHFGVSKHGSIHAYVPVEFTAWHAGDGAVNHASIGIEHEGHGDDYVPNDVQLKASVALAAFLVRELKIPFANIKPHRDFRPTLCPVGFPMEKYRKMVESSVTGNAVQFAPDWKVVLHKNGQVVKILDVAPSYNVVTNLDPDGHKLNIDIRED